MNNLGKIGETDQNTKENTRTASADLLGSRSLIREFHVQVLDKSLFTPIELGSIL